MDESTIALVIAVLALIGAVLPPVIRFIANRKKTKAETADTLVGTSMELLQELKEQADDLKDEVDDLKDEVDAMKARNKELRDGVRVLINQIRTFGHEPEWTLEE